MFNELPFLKDGGEMGKLMRSYDWSSSPIGAADSWPQSLRVTIRVMLNSQHPMFIWWGPELIQFYNDAYRQTMGPAMHPEALGARGHEFWPSIWSIIGPQIERVMSGKGATWNVEQLVPINRNGKPEDVWWTYGYSPIDHEDGVGGVLVICNDVTEQHLRAELYKDQTRKLAQQFEEAPGFITMLSGPDHTFRLANASYRKLMGQRELVGKTVREAVPEAGKQGFIDLLDQVYKTGEPHLGRRTPITLLSDGGGPPRPYYLDFVCQAVRDDDGAVSGIFVEGQDVTEHVLAEQRLELINRELQHRVKNTLAMVQALTMQTLKGVKDRQPVDTLMQRIVALSRAHDTLVQQNWSAAEMGAAARITFENIGMLDRIEMEGPALQLGPSATLSLSMILHELSTNAIKYGALSVEDGRVSLNWEVDDSPDRPELVLRWRERGGPAAVASKGKGGFGTKLIRMGLDGTGSVNMAFETTGLFVELRAPLDGLHRS